MQVIGASALILAYLSQHKSSVYCGLAHPKTWMPQCHDCGGQLRLGELGVQTARRVEGAGKDSTGSEQRMHISCVHHARIFTQYVLSSTVSQFNTIYVWSTASSDDMSVHTCRKMFPFLQIHFHKSPRWADKRSWRCCKRNTVFQSLGTSQVKRLRFFRGCDAPGKKKKTSVCRCVLSPMSAWECFSFYALFEVPKTF